ncbi:unnamed protein product [Schistosoma rodhaini]|uniref:Uncharacterized protein n=1 Tax=Schistosoma rodhaini TaxID=6188 RepID=A0AA85FU39_9TREM|nr:unnamed protein product [Schistosoma rodhaini]
MDYLTRLFYLVNVKNVSCSLTDISSIKKCIMQSVGRRKYLDLVFEDSSSYFQPYFMKERCLSDILTTRKRFIEELPAAYGGHQNHWRYLDGKVVERLDYMSDVLELPSLNCKPNLKRIIDLLTTTIQSEVLGPISRHKLFQMKRKSIQCGKTQNKLEQQRNKTPKQKHYFNSYGKVPSNMNCIQNSLNKKPNLFTHEYLDEMSDKLEEAEQLYKWSQCLPQL